MEFAEAHDDAFFILVNDSARAEKYDNSKNNQQHQNKREESSCPIHGVSPHFESYSLNRQNFDLRTRFERRSILLRKLGAPLFRADLHNAAILGRNAFRNNSRAADDGIHIRRLMSYLQLCFEPSAEQREIQKREDSGGKKADICRAKNETDNSARDERSADKGEVETRHHAERQLRDNTNNSENDEHPIG